MALIVFLILLSLIYLCIILTTIHENLIVIHDKIPSKKIKHQDQKDQNGEIHVTMGNGITGRYEWRDK